MERREFMSAVAGVTTTGVGTGIAGCLRSEGVDVLSAGSLSVTLDQDVGPGFERDTGISYYGEYYGSNTVMRMVEEGQKNPDAVVSADAPLLRDRLYNEYAVWDVVFASNSVVIGYNKKTRLGARLESGEAWYEVLRDAGEGEIAISDPALDPLGYRAVHLFKLAEEKHGLERFTEEILSKVYREPEEPQLLASVRSGNRSVAVAYKNMVVDHGISFYELPDDLNFSDPNRAEEYASVSYTTEDGYVAHGTPVLYSLSVTEKAENAEAGYEFTNYLLENRKVLEENGLTVPEVKFHGNVPEEVGA